MTTVTINQELNGIELKFDAKPLKSTLDALKKIGFRWHNTKKIWYAKKTENRMEIAQAIVNGEDYAEKIREDQSMEKAEKKNVFGVKVGDIFSASWGYEQTNYDFFQVVALVGEKSVRVREVNLPIISREATSGMAENRVYKIITELLPPATHSVFIKDQEKGDIKRLRPGHYKNQTEAMEKCYFKLESFANAQKCLGTEISTYESWYA